MAKKTAVSKKCINVTTKRGNFYYTNFYNRNTKKNRHKIKTGRFRIRNTLLH